MGIADEATTIEESCWHPQNLSEEESVMTTNSHFSDSSSNRLRTPSYQQLLSNGIITSRNTADNALQAAIQMRVQADEHASQRKKSPCPIISGERSECIIWLSNPSLTALRIREEVTQSLVNAERHCSGHPYTGSAESGLAALLLENDVVAAIDQSVADAYVAEVDGDAEKVTNDWAKRMQEIPSNPTKAFLQARRIRSALAPSLSWERAAEQLGQDIESIL